MLLFLRYTSETRIKTLTWFLLNTHHVHDNKNSGHGVASQEDTQSDAEM